MNNQLKRNRKWALLALGLLAAVVLTGVFNSGGEEGPGIDRKAFSLNETQDIDRITVEKGNSIEVLEYTDGKWLLNGVYVANPVNITLIFATIREVSVRREADALSQKSALDSAFSQNGRKITFYRGDEAVHSFEMMGDETNSVTYFKGEDGRIWIMEIPGYKAFIYGLLAVNDPDWRHPNLFHEFNWRNLGGITVAFEGAEPVEIVQSGDFYAVKGLETQTDTTRLTDYIDYISLLEVDGYPAEKRDTEQLEKILEIIISDVANRSVSAEFYLMDSTESRILGVVGAERQFLIESGRLRNLFRNKNYFSTGKQ